MDQTEVKVQQAIAHILKENDSPNHDEAIPYLEKRFGVSIDAEKFKSLVSPLQWKTYLLSLINKDSERFSSVTYNSDGSMTVFSTFDQMKAFGDEQVKRWMEANINYSMRLNITPLSPDIGYYVNVGDYKIPKKIFPEEYDAIYKALDSVLKKMSDYREKRHEEDPSLKRMEMRMFIEGLNAIQQSFNERSKSHPDPENPS
jgi:hypothetical protein